MSEKYTPDEAELIDSYAGVMDEYIGQDYDTAKADAERGIAKIKADAVREAMRMFALGFGSTYPGQTVRDKLNRRAENIEADPHD